MWEKEYADALEYIDNYWQKIIYKPSHLKLRYRLPNILKQGKGGRVTSVSSIKLPYHYFVPNDNKFVYIYYWDSFFMFRGLLGTKRDWLMKDMVENFIYLFNTYKIIPNFSAPASLGRSQPPFLTSMIMDTFLYTKAFNRTIPYLKKYWLKRALRVAKQEYELVWIDTARVHNHHVEGYGLSRYGDSDIGYAHSSELESGWDMTSRFYNRCDQYLPVDLNSYLYKYETDFALAATMLGEEKEAKMWLEKAENRKGEIHKYMWDDGEGCFFDYSHATKKKSNFLSLASFVPLWAGIASPDQAKRLVMKLNKFETEYGLTITAKESLAKPIDLSTIEPRYHPAIMEILKSKQWDYPNIWAPLEYLTVIGLLKYGFINDACRIMKKSIKAHANAFHKHHTFFEKMNGLTGELGSNAEYIDQHGFGWTNAIFFRYIKLIDSIESSPDIYQKPVPQVPPYNLSVMS